jgi:hypothetical protein
MQDDDEPMSRTATSPPRPHDATAVVGLLVLYLLAGASWIASAFGAGSEVSLLFASAMAFVIGIAWMQLRGDDAIERVVALVAVLFVVLLSIGVLGDVAFR